MCTNEETLVITTNIVLTKLSNLIDQSATKEPELIQENMTLEPFSIDKISRKITQLNIALNDNSTVVKKTTCLSPINL